MRLFRFSGKSLPDLIICLFSILLVFLAPKNYSYSFCLILHNLYILTFLFNEIRRQRGRDGLLSFNLLFSVGFYFTSFVYPVFIYNTGERYFSMFDFSYEEDLISYSTAVAYMAYCFLQLGLNNKQKETCKHNKPLFINQNSLKNKLNILSVLFTLLLLIFLLNNGLSYFSDQFIYSMSSEDRVMGYLIQFITPIAYAILIFAFNIHNRKCLCFYYATSIVAFYAIAILSSGSRTIPLSLIIMSLFLYNNKVKRISNIKLIGCGILFIMAMSLVGALRGEGELISIASISENASYVLKDKSENYFSFANELIICNRNLYYLIGSTQTVGYTWGVTLLGSFLGLIPFLRSIFMSTTGIPEYFLNSALYNTFLSTGPFFEKGLGTHVVADIYICWGILGVIFIFYLYGYIITKIEDNKDNILLSVVYYVILSNAIYACRASIFNLNQIFWTLAIVYLMFNIFKEKQASFAHIK